MKTVAEQIQELQDLRVALRDALNAVGGGLTAQSAFRDYVSRVIATTDWRDDFKPSLSLNFMREEYTAAHWRDLTASRSGFANIINFTRSSGGGRFNHLGVYEWVAAGVPRIDHDPGTVSLSTTSNELIGNGVRTFTVTRQYSVGHYVRATADANNWMAGRVLSSSATSVTLWIDKVVGSGTFASWTLIRKLGLLVEESRTNLVPYSNVSGGAWSSGGTIERNIDTGLSGVLSKGCRITRSESELSYNYYQVFAPVPGTAYTFTVYVRYSDGRDINAEFGQPGVENTSANPFTLVVNGNAPVWSAITKTVLPDGLVRLTHTVTPPDNVVRGWGILIRHTHKAGLPPLIVTGYQIEAGAFPTSHIPTTDAQVTRAADVATVSDLSDWYRAEEGTVVARAISYRPNGFPPCFELSPDYHLYRNASNGRIAENGRGSAGISSLPAPIGSIVASVFTNDYILNAAEGAAGVLAMLPRLHPTTALNVGLKYAGGPGYFGGHIEEIQFIPRALSATELQRITA